MLRIRFSRTGKVGQPSYRIVVAERSAPVKGRYIEILGNYMPARKPKIITVKQERVSYWMSKGAIPTESIASILKKQGIEGMDKYMRAPGRKRKSKNEEKPAAAPAVGGSKAPEAPVG